MTNAILVLDDAATARMYHRSILEQGNFSVAEAANGYEALEVTLQRQFDLMLVDVNMPRMDGYTFVESVRRAGLRRDAAGQPATVRFYFDANVLGLAKAAVRLRSHSTYPGDPAGVVHKASARHVRSPARQSWNATGFPRSHGRAG
jgi:CheY-like chemotaxis protein